MTIFGKARLPSYLANRLQQHDKDLQVLYGLNRIKTTPQTIQAPFGGTAPPSTTLPVGLQIYPFTMPSQDLGTVGLMTVNIDLGTVWGGYTRMTLDDDIGLAFNNPPNDGVAIVFYLDIIQDGTGGHAVTFPGSVVSAPTIDTDPNARNLILCATQDNGTTYVCINLGSGSGSVNFPIIYDVDERTVGSSSEVIDLATTDAHVHFFNLTGDIDITFDNPPASGKDETIEIYFKQDGTGGWAVTWNDSISPIPTIDTTPDAETLVIIQKFGSEAFYRSYQGGSSSAGGTIWSLVDIDVDKDMLNYGLENLGYITFNVSSGVAPKIDVNSSATVMDFYLNGSEHMALSRGTASGFEGTGVLEVYGNVTTGYSDANPAAAVKTVSNDATPSVNQVIGEFAFDAFNSTPARLTYARIRAIIDDKTASTEDGHLSFQAVKAGTVTEAATMDASNFILNGVTFQSLDVGSGEAGTILKTNTAFLFNSTDQYSLQIAGTVKVVLDSSALYSNTTGDVSLGLSSKRWNGIYGGFASLSTSLTMVTQTGAPTVNGEMRLDGNDVKIYSNSAVHNISQMPELNAINTWTNDNLFRDIFPSSDAVYLNGDSGASWLIVRSAIFQINATGGSISGSTYSVSAESAGMAINSPTGKFTSFYFNGSEKVRFEDDGKLNWRIANQQHRISVNSASFDFWTQNTDDELRIYNGTSSSDYTGSYLFGSLTLQRPDTNPVPAKLILKNILDTTDSGIPMGWIQFNSVNDHSPAEELTYANIQCDQASKTDGAECGDFYIDVVSNGSDATGFNIMGSTSGLKLGFFGVSPVVKPTVTGSRGGNAALASFLTALANLGLITDSTSA